MVSCGGSAPFCRGKSWPVNSMWWVVCSRWYVGWMFFPTYHLPPTTYVVTSGSRRGAASLHSHCDVRTT